MGISGLLNQIGRGQRVSLAKLSAQYFTKYERPFRLAIDISIWLFQIQSGKGGSNPALRTFYYRLLRILSLNIHPLFVFDGPNKPLFKRNKKVGGPGVRVASVPEFLAKQLLKQLGFPWHVAPGEAEAECALLQREGIVDAVLSEDVDTLMFGSRVTLRNWAAENSSKTPTHVDVHRDDETKAQSGMDSEGMILVALMSGGDYLPEGIPGCGPKVACDAARAGFGRDLCALKKGDRAGLTSWKERLLHEIRTNESKFFSRRSTTFTIPEDFPNREVLGFYTHPCVSTAEKLTRLRKELHWDQAIDFAALRSFTGDAFDWRCMSGAKKFIKNLAPALLIRELRLRGGQDQELDLDAQEEMEKGYVQEIHGKRNHITTDGELEYRISIIPEKLVPIDLSLEDEDDEIVPSGEIAEGISDNELELPPGTQGETESNAPVSPTKKRNFRPYDPSAPEKLWILRPFLQVGCPLLIEEHEASTKDPIEFLKQRRKARAAAKGDGNIHTKPKNAKKAKVKDSVMPVNGLMAYARVTKASSGRQLKELDPDANSRSNSQSSEDGFSDGVLTAVATFKLPSTQLTVKSGRSATVRPASQTIDVLNLATTKTGVVAKAVRAAALSRPFAAFAVPSKGNRSMAAGPSNGRGIVVPQTPKRGNKKRTSADLSSPLLSQRTITSFCTPTPRKQKEATVPQDNSPEIIDLLSSPISTQAPSQHVRTERRPSTPTPPNIPGKFTRRSASPPSPAFLDFSSGKLSDDVTKRRKRSPLKRWRTEPVLQHDDAEFDDAFGLPTQTSDFGSISDDLAAITPAKSDSSLASPSTFLSQRPRSSSTEGGSIPETVDEEFDATPKALRECGRAPDLETIGVEMDGAIISNSQLIPPVFSVVKARPPIPAAAPKATWTKQSTTVSSMIQPSHRSPRRQAVRKRIQVRESLEGAWKEVRAEEVDMTGDGSGWKKSGGKAQLSGWRQSGVDVVDLTGA